MTEDTLTGNLLFDVLTPLGFRVRVTTYPTDAIKEGVRIWHK